jgi:hypothetical protein
MKIYACLIGLLFFSFNSFTYGQELLKDEFTLKLSSISKSKKYGYSQKKPIKVGGMSPEGVRAQNFLSALKGPNGEKVAYQRLGSCCSFKTPNAIIGNKAVLDMYEVYYKGLDTPIKLYINEYDYESPACPKGFTYKTEDEIKEVKKVALEDIKKVSTCNDALFCVEGFLIKEALEGNTFLTPDVSPQPKDGIDVLKNYFSKNPLKDERAANSMFRVSIGFVVNCKGEAGNYFIISQGKGDLEELANQILEITNELSIKWLPAEKDGEKVDSYQTLSFSVFQGQLDKVSIK